MVKASLIALLSLLSSTSFSQIYGDPAYYLIDSLDLSSITFNDSVLIEKNLKDFYAAENDSLRFVAVNHIVEESWDYDIWPAYNDWQYLESKRLIDKGGKTDREKRILKKVQSNALNNKGFYQAEIGNADKAIEYYRASVDIDREIGDLIGVGVGINNMAGVMQKQGRVTEALDLHFFAAKLRQFNNDLFGLGQSYNNIGGILQNQGQDSVALTYYLKSLKIRREAGQIPEQGAVLNNIASIYDSREQNDSAIHYYHQSLAINQRLNFQIGIGHVANNLGSTYAQIGENDSAMYYYEMSLSIREGMNDKQGLATTLNSLAVYYWKRRVVDGEILVPLSRIEELAQRSLEYSQEIGFPMLIKNAADILSKIYAEKGQAKDVLQMCLLKEKMLDSIENLSIKEKAFQEQAEYQYEMQKAVDKAQNEKLIAIEKGKKKRQQLVIYATVLGLILLIVFLLFVFNRLKITRKQKDEINIQREEIQLQHEKLEDSHKEIKDSINYAKRIQTAILPKNEIVHEAFSQSFVLYIPKDVVAGDFYWLAEKGDKTFIAAADCTGHGVPGAMVSVVCNNALNRSVKEFQLSETGSILDKARELVVEEFEKSDDDVKDGMDIALCAFSQGKVQFSGANNPLWIIRKNELIEVKGDKQPVGKHDGMVNFTSHEIVLKEGDRVYVFSDGYADQFGGVKGKKLKTKGLREILLAIQDLPIEKQKARLKEHFDNWKGNYEQLDDVCFIGIEV